MNLYQIPAHELRIGNRVALPCCASHATIAAISTQTFDIAAADIDLFGDDLKGFPITEAYGIELTPEILTGCGFVKGRNGKHLVYRGISALAEYRYVLQPDGLHISVGDDDYGVLIYRINHLHALQNFFFATNGEELTLPPLFQGVVQPIPRSSTFIEAFAEHFNVELKRLESNE